MCYINAHCKIWHTAGRLISCCHNVHCKYAYNRILCFKQDIVIIHCVKADEVCGRPLDPFGLHTPILDFYWKAL